MHAPRRKAFYPPSLPTRYVAGDLVCVACGYNLRGMAQDDRCPECGSAVAPSHARSNVLRADSDWIRDIRVSLVLMIGAAGLSLFTTMPFVSNETAAFVLRIVCHGAALSAVWIISEEEPRRREHSPLCQALRFSSFGMVPIVVISAGLAYGRSGSAAGSKDLAVFCLIIASATIVTTILYYERVLQIALRFRWPMLALSARLTGLGICFATFSYIGLRSIVSDAALVDAAPTAGLGCTAVVVPVVLHFSSEILGLWPFYFWLLVPMFLAAAITLLVVLHRRLGRLIDKPVMMATPALPAGPVSCEA